MRKAKPRKYTIDGREYSVSISAGEVDEDQEVHLRVSFRALFGTRSVCLVRGVTNRSYWHDYPNVEKMRTDSIFLSPKVARALIHRAHSAGWSPETSKSNFEMLATKETIRAIIARTEKPAEPGAAPDGGA
jgi:hypothetical protein